MIDVLAAFLLLAPPPRPPRNPKPPPPAPVTTTIALRVKTAAGEVHALAEPRQPPAAARPIAVLKSGEKPQVRWEVRNSDLQKPVSSIVVHFLITREPEAGASIPAAPQKGSYQDSVLGTDLAPREATSGEYNTAIYEPGVYLIELEILDEQGARRQFCALDLKVE